MAAASPMARVVWTSQTGHPNHAEVVERIHRAPVRREPQVKVCRTAFPEPHLAGEFPMTCFDCHMVADS